MAVNMVPKKSVVVIRDGKRVKPEIGKAFPFTTKERDALLEADPASLRKPTDETAEYLGAGSEPDTDDDAPDGDEDSGAPSSAEKSQAAARGGKKKPTANKSDAEAAQDDDL